MLKGERSSSCNLNRIYDGGFYMEKVMKLTFTVAEMAQALCIGTNCAYDLVHREDFPKIKVGSRILIPIKALEEWLVGNSMKKTS
jgi:excisionase family DNA binding protein